MAGFLRRITRRTIDYVRDNRLGQTIGQVLIGGQSPTSAGGAFAIGVYRKLIAAVIGGLIAWLHTSLGWDVASFLGDDFETLLIEAITAYLVWRLPNGTPAREAAT